MKEGTAPTAGKATLLKVMATQRVALNGKATIPKEMVGEGTDSVVMDGKTTLRKAMSGAVEEGGATAMTLKATNGAGTAPANGGTATRQRTMTGTGRKVTVGTATKQMVDGEGTSRTAVVDPATEITTMAAAVVAKAHSGSSSPPSSTVCLVAVKEAGTRAVGLGVVRATAKVVGEAMAAGVGMVRIMDSEDAGVVLET